MWSLFNPPLWLIAAMFYWVLLKMKDWVLLSGHRMQEHISSPLIEGTWAEGVFIMNAIKTDWNNSSSRSSGIEMLTDSSPSVLIQDLHITPHCANPVETSRVQWRPRLHRQKWLLQPCLCLHPLPASHPSSPCSSPSSCSCHVLDRSKRVHRRKTVQPVKSSVRTVGCSHPRAHCSLMHIGKD